MELYLQASLDLSNIILRPVAKLLENKQLVIVSDGVLSRVPFASLPVPTTEQNPVANFTFLSAENVIVQEPSLSVLALLRKQIAHRTAADKMAFVVGDSVFSKNDTRVSSNGKESSIVSSDTLDINKEVLSEPTELTMTLRSFGRNGELSRLESSREEAKNIYYLMSEKGFTQLLLDFDANREMVMDGDIGNYRYIHFATHALIDEERPILSKLALSLVDTNGTEKNGFLNLNDIYSLKLKADLVVLSACESALGKDVRGEGLLGLTRAFMYAGTPRVIASLWKVNDEVTEKFMTYLYSFIVKENLPPALALHKAQLKMQKHPRWHAPYYWAAFTLQGEWQ